MKNTIQRKISRISLTITWIYMIMGVLSIIFYENIILVLFKKNIIWNFLYSYKEYIYIITTGLLFYLMTNFYVTYILSLNKRLKKSYGILKKYSKEIGQTKKEYYKLAYYDELTGLPNQVLFEHELNKKIDESDNKFIGILYLDLDNFKTVNNTLGHTYGDLLLKQVSELLLETFKEEALVSRFGEDEFVIMIPDLDYKDSIKQRIDDLLKSFDRTWILDGREFIITVSIGVAFYPENGDNAYSIIKNADTSMYNVKKKGRRGFSYYSTEMKDDLLQKLEIEADLRQAIINEEFLLYYQPQIDIKTKKIVGLEALIRWNHPTKGMIAPNNFIPIAEKTGLIIKIGEWVIRTCCNQLKDWLSKGYEPIKIGINLSARQFQQHDLVKMVNDIIYDTELNPEYIELEITESIAMKNLELTTFILNKLRKTGIKISLDDFGTGYSSLNYLKQLPIDNLKMDRSFIQSIHKNIKEEAIAKTIIDLAHNLSITVTAEGMEESDQLISLEKHNCDIAQGFLFSRPLPAHEIDKLIA